MNIEIANRLVQLRREHKLSQEELAHRLGLSRQAVSKWERAEASPDTDNLILLSRLYGVSLDALLQTDQEIPLPENDAPEQADNPSVSDKGTVEVRRERVLRFLSEFPFWGLATLVFLLLGVLGGWWHPGWMVFLTVPLYASAVKAICQRNAAQFWYPLAVVIAYLALGFFGGWWHPGWILFFTVPIYYWAVSFLRKF